MGPTEGHGQVPLGEPPAIASSANTADVTLPLNGREWILRFDEKTVRRIEGITGENLLGGPVRFPDFGEIGAMLWAHLLPVRPETTHAEAAALITPPRIPLICAAIFTAWGKAQAEEARAIARSGIVDAEKAEENENTHAV